MREMVNNEVVELFEKASNDDADEIIKVKSIENISCDLLEMVNVNEDFSCNEENNEMEDT